MSRPAGPPADVPTLTEVVRPPVAGEPAKRGNPSPDLQELLIQQVMLKVDLVLMPRFREEMERVVRESVAQAFEHESAPGQARRESR